MILPIGVTRETITGILKGDEAAYVKCIIAVTVPGLEKEKKSILSSIEVLSDMLRVEFQSITVIPGDAQSIVKVYEALREKEFDRLIVVAVTGSRYLLPILFMVALKIWKERGGEVEVLLLHGVEGEEYELVPLAGFIAPAIRISNIQYRILGIVYGSNETISGKDLMERYGFTRSVYYVLADLERKGLLKVRRGRIERTFPGEIFYLLLLRGDKT